MRHQVLDLQTQQQQQQNFLASLHQTTIMKEVQKPNEINHLETTVTTATTATTMISKNSINNCIISMNSNGQYQIKPRIIVKDPVKATMSPLIFPNTTSSGGNNQSIQSE